MELIISKYNGKNKENDRKTYPILDYKILTNNTSLLLVEDGQTDVEDNIGSKNQEYFQVYKVQFIASCKIDLAPAVIVAFYIGERGQLYSYVLSGLPDSYMEEGTFCMCIDYKSYVEVCELTSETKLSLIDYIKEVKSGAVGANSFLNYNKKAYNYNQQKDLWKQLEEKEVVLN